MVSILCLMLVSPSYRSLKSSAPALASHAFATAAPSAAAPLPPSAWWVHSTQSSAPAAMAASLITACSASVSVGNMFIATTTGTPNFLVFSMCLVRFTTPFLTSSTSSLVYSCGRGLPGDTAGPPPWSLRALTVATMTAQWGFMPLLLHFRFMNFSRPMSAPNPASVRTYPPAPTIARPIWSAMMDELPDAMLAKGPACTSTGVPSRVCISVGLMASFMSATSAPVIPRSSAVTGSPFTSGATTIAPSLRSMSAKEVVMASTAMISEATVMSKPVSRVYPFSVGFCPTVILRRNLSFMSTTRRHEIFSRSMFRRANAARSSAVSSSGSVLSMPSFRSLLSMDVAKARVPSFFRGQRRSYSASSFWVSSWNTLASMAAARRLFAAPMAWMSPVRWRFISSIGTTCEYPPPAAPPLMPKVGPIEGWRMHATQFFSRCAPMACARPMVVVDLPSPSGVGLMPATTT
mmetsp:Transcript_13594/g.53643  ORF Transcript_13594/g.53643 Transcript_13594/m.53643 type:complete len:463 (-) Transcript_13594:359-1747(-)